MKQSSKYSCLIILVLTITMTISCSKTLVEASTRQMQPTPKAAITTQVITDIDLDVVPFPVYVPCANGGAGEWLKPSGIVRQLAILTINGNHFTAKMQYTPLGVKSVGLTTGDIYNAAGVNSFVETGSFINDSYTFTNINNFNNIGVGGTAVKSKWQQQVRIRIQSDGTITSNIDKITASCQ